MFYRQRIGMKDVVYNDHNYKVVEYKQCRGRHFKLCLGKTMATS